MAESEEVLKSPLKKVKEEREKNWLKTRYSKSKDHGIKTHHFMANTWGNNGESDRLYFWGFKITADGDCGHDIERRLLLGRKAMTNLDRIFKSRDITLPTKVHVVKALVLPTVVYECETWTIKKAKCQRIDAFELWCRRRLLRVPCLKAKLYITKGDMRLNSL